jgi:hypothetical protein
MFRIYVITARTAAFYCDSQTNLAFVFIAVIACSSHRILLHWHNYTLILKMVVAGFSKTMVNLH